MDDRLKKLEELYADKSRHSQYQVLATSLENRIRYEKPPKPKYEKERWKYISDNVDMSGKTVLDIGANTGFFTFECCKDFRPRRVDCYEGNVKLARFMELATEVLELQDVVKVHPEYFLFDGIGKFWDVVFFLNVIHHIGFDFEKDVQIDKVKDKIIEHINTMARYSKLMVFSMGYNWYGDIARCLFEHGTKREMEDYVIQGTRNYWEIDKIGIAVKEGNTFKYSDINEANNVRVDAYGEFLNRPLFIMKSKLL